MVRDRIVCEEAFFRQTGTERVPDVRANDLVGHAHRDDLQRSLRHTREVRADPADFRAAVRRVFTEPDVAAVPEWEPLAATRERLLPAVRRILAAHPGEDIVLVGQGTAWTLLVSELTASPPDLDAWAALRMPDVWRLDAT